MPNVMSYPRIDPTVKHIGVSKLRGLNADKLRTTGETFVIQENDTPLAVLLTYDKFLEMQDQLESVAQTVDLLSNKTEFEAFKAGLQDMIHKRFRSLDDIDADIAKAGK